MPQLHQGMLPLLVSLFGLRDFEGCGSPGHALAKKLATSDYGDDATGCHIHAKLLLVPVPREDESLPPRFSSHVESNKASTCPAPHKPSGIFSVLCLILRHCQ